MPQRLTILVVEDNHDLRDTTVQVLCDEGHKACGIACAEDLPEQCSGFDLMLIDLNLPGEDGLTLAARIRRLYPGMGLIMVTARRLPEDRRRGYDTGADIYLSKPVSFEELTAAVAALGRRLRPEDGPAQLQLNRKGLILQGLAGQRVRLSPHEAILLAAFSTASEQRLAQWALIELLRKDSAVDPKGALELQIVRLRKKLQQAGALEPSIQAIRGWGYQLCVDIVQV